MPEPVADRWGGVYGGASFGYGFLNDRGAPTGPAHGDDWVFGGHLGYNYQWGNFVVGVEGNIDRADIMFTDGSEVKGDVLYAGRMRFGYGTDAFLVYGTIGAEHATTKRGNLAFLGVTEDPKDTTLQLGAGVDLAINDKLSLGIDYTWAKYKKFDEAALPFPLDVTTQKASARLTYTFN
jgi:outer membrane immunogenic protein